MEAMAKKPLKLTAKLRWLMELEDLTQAALAEIAGVSQASVNTYLDGATPATPGTVALLRIARHFKVPMEWLADDAQGVEDFNDAALAALARYPDDKVIAFISQRWADACKQLVDHLDVVDKIDWDKLAAALAEVNEKAKQEGKPRPMPTLDGGTVKPPANLPKHLATALEAAIAILPLAGSTIGQFEILEQWAAYAAQLHDRHKAAVAKISKATEVVGIMLMQMVRPKK